MSNEEKIDVTIDNIVATFVGTRGTDGFNEVIKDFEKAQEVRILTYSKIGNDKGWNRKLKIIKQLHPEKKLRIIVAMPGLRNVKGNINLYIENDIIEHLEDIKNQITAKYSSEDLEIYVCFKNHAKLVGTENILYVGSANYNDYSFRNYEAGMIIKDKNVIREIYDNFFDEIVAVQYCGDDYDAAKVKFLSLFDAGKELEFHLDSFISYFDERVDHFNEIKLICNNMKKIIDSIIDNNENMPDELLDDTCIIREYMVDISEILLNTFDWLYDKSIEYFMDYYENIHMASKGVYSNDAWIDEETPYVMLMDDAEYEDYISEYWADEWIEKPEIKEVQDLLKIVIKTAETWKDKEPYDIFKSKMIEIGTDENVQK